ncbi:MAG: GHMP kinase [Candidatus Omnitrophota bacterium]|jgi:D-glycero-alpha-D-manno-heptose-7-phosphate kinase
MILSRTPFRISFAGGGTDLPEFYLKEEGQVISTGIDKYIYVAVKRQTAISEYKFRINWSKVEFKDKIEDIEHPIVREALKMMDLDIPLEVSTFADIPANTGLGSSSSFAVGLLHALFALKGKMVTKGVLAGMASRLEIDVLKRTIGKQDHYAAAYGSLNVFTFHTDGTVSVDPVFYRPEIKETIENHLMLFYTAIKRDAHDILSVQNTKTQEKRHVLVAMRDLVAPLREILSSGADIREFGRLLHKGWLLKKSITDEISSSEIDGYYNRALSAGALGGKLLGAGGGGFLLFFVEPKKQPAVAHALNNLYRLPFKFENAGTRITYYDQSAV